MRHTRTSILAAILAVTFAVVASAQPLAPQRNLWSGAPSVFHQTAARDSNAGPSHYDAVPIPVLPGKNISYVNQRAINNGGQVVGYSFSAGSVENQFLTGQGFLWDHGTLLALPLIPGFPGAFAFGINDKGDIVGSANTADGSGNIHTVAVMWTKGRPVVLSALNAGWNSDALDSNTAGVVVGATAPFPSNSPVIPIVWRKGAVAILPVLNDYPYGWAFVINEAGVIAGYLQGATGQVPVLWYPDNHGEYTVANLGNSLGGSIGTVNAINNRNQAVGYSAYPSPTHDRAVVWQDNAVEEYLAPLPGDTDADPLHINDAGEIVGLSALIDNSGNFLAQHSVVWDHGVPHDLQTLVPASAPSILAPIANNDGGEIAVVALNPATGMPFAAVLVPKDQ